MRHHLKHNIGGFVFHHNRYGFLYSPQHSWGIRIFHLAELWFVYTYNLVNVGNSASFLLPPLVLSLFLASIRINLPARGVYRLLREYSLFIYLVHPWFLFICSAIAKKLCGMENYHLPVFVATVVLSVATAELLRRHRKYRYVNWLC